MGQLPDLTSIAGGHCGQHWGHPNAKKKGLLWKHKHVAFMQWTNGNCKGRGEWGTEHTKTHSLMPDVRSRVSFQSCLDLELQTFWPSWRRWQNSLGTDWESAHFSDVCAYSENLILISDTWSLRFSGRFPSFYPFYLERSKSWKSWNTCQANRECLKLSNLCSLRQVPGRHITLTAKMLRKENTGTFLKTALGALETRLFLDRAYVKGKHLQRWLFDSDSYLCSDIWCLLLPTHELLLGFKKDTGDAKISSMESL